MASRVEHAREARALSTRGLRVRIILLVVLAVLPAIALTVYNGVIERRRAERRGEESASRAVHIVGSEIETLIASTRQLLRALSVLPAVRNADARSCTSVLTELLADEPQFANLGAVDARGRLFCSALPVREPLNLADRLYVRQTLETGAYTLGEFQVGRVSGRATVNLGYPIRRDERTVGVVFAALDLAHLNRVVGDVRLPRQSALTLIDPNGVVLLRRPDPDRWLGRSVGAAPIVRVVLERRFGRVRREGIDGIERIWAFTTIGQDRPGAYLYAGIPTSALFGPVDAALRANVIGLLVIAALALLAAVWIGNRFVVAPVQHAFELQEEATEREREASATLREAAEMKNTFLAAVAHDIRNPMAAIRGFAQLLKKHRTLPEEDQIEMLQMIEASSIRLERLLTSLLDLERLSRGTIRAERQPAELLALIERVVGELDLREHPVEVHGEETVANVDVVQIERMVENLVRNAVKYTPSRSAIDVRLDRPTPEEVRIAVEDRGPGVPDPLKEAIFEAFRRGEESAPSSGMGVGLHLVARFAELHGGRAWVEDRSGGGARFVVLLRDET